MDNATVLAIGGVVGTLAKFITSAGVSGRAAVLSAVVVSMVVCGIFLVSQGHFTLAELWPDFEGFANVLLVAGGSFHVIENSPAASAAVSRMSGGSQ